MGEVTLRHYQVEAVRASVLALREAMSALVVMPTGTGKTTVFVELARLAHRGRVLLLSHRDELVLQAAQRVFDQLGVSVGIEKAQSRPDGERIVCGSVQTISRRRRLAEWPADAFSLIVVDEAHHAAAASYRRILEHFTEAKVVGVTATPDRADGKGLRSVFDTVAYEYSIAEAIADGWLVEPTVWRVHVDSIHLEGVRRTHGDLAQGQLEEAVARGVHAAAQVMLERSGDRPTLAYTPGVDTAHSLAAVLRAARPGCAAAIDGTTPTDERRELLRAHAAGEYQFLVNCQVLTEGYDSPTVSCLAMLRPTLSRGLYAQMLGRGLRPSPGKGDCLVLDFAGSAGRHSLAGPEDVLGAADDDEAVAKEARSVVEESGEAISVSDALVEARARVRYRLERVEAEAERKKKKLAPAHDIARILGVTLSGGGGDPSQKQAAAIERFGVDASGLSRRSASAMIDALISRAKLGLATPKQLRLLDRQNMARRDLTRERASAMIGRVTGRSGRLAQQSFRR